MNQHDTFDEPTLHYDPAIIPAETAARKEREGQHFGHPLHEAQADPKALHTMDGYTVDREGLLNNYAIEPEMYIHEPGDLREEQQALAAKRARELAELAEGEEWNLTMEHDFRHKGPGLI